MNDLPIVTMLQISMLVSISMLLLEILVFRVTRESIHRNAIFFWFSYSAYFIYSYFSEGFSAIVIAGSTLFWIPRTIAIRRILEGLVGRDLARRGDYWTLAATYVVGLGLYAHGESFAVYTTPAALVNFYLGAKYFWSFWRLSGRTVPHFFFALNIIMVFIHILDYPVLRFNHEFTWVGFSVVLLTTLFLAMTLPTLITRQVIEEKRLHLEALVEERTDLYRLQAELFHRGKHLASLAHEINNPLGIVLGRAGQLKKLVSRGNLSQDAMDSALDQMRNSVERIRHIVQHQGLGTTPSTPALVRRRVALSEIIGDVMIFVRERLTKLDVPLTLDLVENAELKVDAIQISQILVNLINNAADACGNSDRPWIKITAETKEKKLQISVTDSGPGVPDHVRERLMSPFYTTKGEVGTGLGLYLSRELARSHGGALRFDPINGVTRFLLELPLAPDP